MKYCTKCGQQLTDDATFCIACGAATDGSNHGSLNGNQANYYSAPKSKRKDNTAYTVAWILMILSTIASGFFLIPLCWCLPMTLKVKRARDEGEELSLGFKICVLIFVNTISGILLLVGDESL